MKYLILFLIAASAFGHVEEKETVLWTKVSKDSTETVTRRVVRYDGYDTYGNKHQRTTTKTKKVIVKKPLPKKIVVEKK